MMVRNITAMAPGLPIRLSAFQLFLFHVFTFIHPLLLRILFSFDLVET